MSEASRLDRSTASVTVPTATVVVELVSWVTKFAGGDGTGRRLFPEPLHATSTVRSVLTGLSARHPELHAALWHGDASTSRCW